ncbi:MAG: putative collagen-binding domain-containing protein, partial [Vicinamibacterales bacterium]
GVPDDPAFVSARLNMGWARNYAERLPLAAMTPQPELTSTGYALAQLSQEAAEILVYQPDSGAFTVDLSDTRRDFLVEWFDPSNGQVNEAGRIAGGRMRVFTPPFASDAVLYLKAL